MILLVNGPNLNLLGEREAPGAATLDDVERTVEQTCAAHGHAVRCFQSSSEGALVDFLHAHRREARGVVLNPGALAYTSWALRDCLDLLGVPAVEVQLSSAWPRPPSVLAPAVRGRIEGLGVEGYRLAALWLCQELAREASAPARQGAAAQPAVRAQPAPGHEGASGRSWAGRAFDPSDLAEPGEDIPVDRTKRGDYEPL